MKLRWRSTKKPEPFRAELSSSAPVSDKGRLDDRSETWAFIHAYCTERLEGLRQANDNASLDELKTAGLRGQIKMLKEILDLPKPKPTMHYDQDEWKEDMKY